MKTLYFDTNYLFRLYSTEPGAAEVQALANEMGSIVIAWHGRAELASILLRKRRQAALTKEAAKEIRGQIEDDVALGLVEFLPLTDAVMTRLETVLVEAPPPSISALPTLSTSPVLRNMVLTSCIPTTGSFWSPPRSSA